MIVMNTAQTGSEWDSVVNSAAFDKPQFIKRTQDYMFLSDIGVIETLLSVYAFHAEFFPENDGTVTASLDEIDLVENGANEHDALQKLAGAILEYSKDYYGDYSYWARGERKAHLPYVIKSLILNNAQKIGGLIKCRHGRT